jgi:integrase
MPWGEWCDTWTANRLVAPSTAATARQNIGRHLRPRWGPVQLGSITKFDIQAWVSELAETLAPATVDKLAHLLCASLAAAVDAGLLAATPYVSIKLPAIPPGTEFYFSPEQIDCVLGELVEPYRRAVLILVLTGMRFGEMAGLHWQRVDTTHAVIDVVETWSPAAGAIRPYPKGKRRRVVPLLPELAAELGEPVAGRRCGLAHERHGADCRSPLVCPAPGGGALDARNMRRRHWYPALQAAGLTRARQHDLRHTFASWLRQRGVSLDDIGEVLGHADSRMSQRYAHVAATHLDRVRAAMQQDDQPRNGPRPNLKIVPKPLSGP